MNLIDEDEIHPYDPKLVYKDQITCNICQRILINPKKCIKCSMCFCGDCIAKWTKYFSCCYNACNTNHIVSVECDYLNNLKFKGKKYPKTYQERLIRDWKQEYRVNVTKDRSDGIGVYTGELFENSKSFQKDGYGIYEIYAKDKCSLKYKYEGQWKENRKNGYGIERFYYFQSTPEENHSNNCYDYYDGDFAKNKKEGFGVCNFINGDSYIGQWSNDMMNGKGKYYFINKDTFSGIFVNGKKEGSGVYHYSNEDTYQCNWKEDNKCIGEGNVIFKNEKAFIYTNQSTDTRINQNDSIKKEYSGKWILNKTNRLIFLSNDKYHEKHLKKCMMTGRKKALTYNATVYDGSWVEGNKKGFGKEISLGGDEYEGNWENDMKNGKGVKQYADGCLYKGDWKYNIIEGYGVMIYNNGNIYEGEWDGNKKKGKGVMYYSDGSLYEGKWKEDKKHGKGIFRDKNVFVTLGHWYYDTELKQQNELEPSNCIII